MNQDLLKETEIVNLRDLGGIVNTEGKKVKEGCFYRSAVIAFAHDKAKKAFDELHIKAILDLRSQMERESAPDMSEDCDYYPISAINEQFEFQGNLDMSALMKENSKEVLMSYMVQMYAQLPFHNPAYQKMFELMLNQQVPMIFHCSAGKDRTGVAAYLILKMLGVEDKFIMEDYLLSNVYRKEENDKAVAMMKDESFRVLMEVQPEYLMAAMNAVQEKYPCFEDYLLSEYQLTSEKISLLRKYYLE